MKIVHITYMFTFGGIETMLVNIANEQARLGHRVDIIVVENEATDGRLTALLDPRIRLHCAKRKAGRKDVLAVARINYFLLRAKPDAVHIHSSGLMRCILIPGHRKRTCMTLHALPTDQNTVAIETVPRVFAISEAVREALKEKYHINATVICNGIHPENIRTRRPDEKHDGFRLVCISRLEHEKKGQDLLIDALSELKRRGLTSLTLDFIGDGASRPYLEQRCKEFDVDSQVRFLGARPPAYIFEHLADYDLFVQPSRNEGFALTVAEAMAARVPVLVSSGQGPEEVIEHGKCGYIFSNGDAIDCADHIEKLINNGEDSSVTDRAFKRVGTTYNVKTTAKSYLESYLCK